MRILDPVNQQLAFLPLGNKVITIFYLVIPKQRSMACRFNARLVVGRELTYQPLASFSKKILEGGR